MWFARHHKMHVSWFSLRLSFFFLKLSCPSSPAKKYKPLSHSIMTDLANDPPLRPPGNVLLDSSQSPTPTVVLPSPLDVATPKAILNPFDPCLPLPDSQCDSLYLVAPQTWAQLNPNLGVQAQHPRAKATDATKATRKVNEVLNKANIERLATDLEKKCHTATNTGRKNCPGS